MIPLEEAQALVLSLVAPLEVDEVGLRHAAGRVLRRPVSALRDQPPFDASAMDGYALRAAPAGARLTLVGEAAAGQGWSGHLGAGEAVRIFTGAPVPEGADAVEMQENVTREAGAIRLGPAVAAGRNIRPRGSDFAAGQSLSAPRRLRPAELGLIAAMNVPRIGVTRRPVVAILSTGSELVQPGEAPRADQIVASNAFALAPMIEAEGAEARILPVVRDDEAALRAALDLAAGADLVVTIGGASVGDHDLMAQAGDRLGLTLAMHKVAIRPGKPILAGRRGAQPLIGLPGNPVSALVCALLFVLPAVRAMLGLPDPLPAPARARAAVDLPANGERTHFMRARLEAGSPPGILPVASQDSARIWLFAEAQALIIRPAGAGPVRAGDDVDYLAL